MGTTQRQMAYTAYGYRTGESGLGSLLGFNGERPEPITGHYLLGQGNHAYAYGGGDPVNWYDPGGDIPFKLAIGTVKFPIFKFNKTINSSEAVRRPVLQSTQIARTNKTVELLADTQPVPVATFKNPMIKERVPFEKLPPEPKMVGSRISQNSQRTAAQTRVMHHAMRRHAAAIYYDQEILNLIKKYPQRKISINKTEFEAATNNLKRLRAEKADRKLINYEISNITRIRRELKLDSLEQMGQKTGVNRRRRR